MQLAWLTDVHLNFCPGRLQELLDRIDAAEPDAVLIGGDIGEAPDVTGYLQQFATLARPVYFVLGNHDFYRGSIRQIRAAVDDLCQRIENLHYLPSAGVVELSPSAALIGHDGWGDARVRWGRPKSRTAIGCASRSRSPLKFLIGPNFK